MAVTSKRHTQDVRLVIQYQTRLAHDWFFLIGNPYFQYFAIVCQVLRWVFQAFVLQWSRFVIQQSLVNNKSANKSLVGELLQPRFFEIILPAKANFQAVCSAGPQSPQLKRYSSFWFYLQLDNRAANKRIEVLIVQFGEIERDWKREQVLLRRDQPPYPP